MIPTDGPFWGDSDWRETRTIVTIKKWLYQKSDFTIVKGRYLLYKNQYLPWK